MIAEHIAREQITVSNTAIGLNAVPTMSATVKTAARYADVQVQAYQVRATIDGTAVPVAATTGMLLSPGSTYRIWGLTNIENFSMIRETSDATVVVNYWGRD